MPSQGHDVRPQSLPQAFHADALGQNDLASVEEGQPQPHPAKLPPTYPADASTSHSTASRSMQPTGPQPPAVKPPKRQLAPGDEGLLTTTLGERLLHTLVDGLVVVIALYLWLQGAKFTLLSLNQSTAIRSSTTLINVWWGVPLFLSAMELKALPRLPSRARDYPWWTRLQLRWHKLRRQPKLMWVLLVIVLIVDIGSSWMGFTRQVAGQPFPIFGWRIPTEGGGLHGLGLVVGLVLAYGPERLLKYAKIDLVQVWQLRKP